MRIDRHIAQKVVYAAKERAGITTERGMPTAQAI
jgi:hypothetical protein